MNPPAKNFNSQFQMRPVFLLLASFISLHLLAQPTISSFSPAAGPVGTTVIINGTNFSTTAVNNIVYFGAVKANVSAATTGTLTVVVPAGSTYQPISVTTSGLTGYSAQPFIATFTGGGQINSSTFSSRIDSLTDLHPNGIAIADFDGDGKPDIATANNYSINGQPASISILRNIAAGATMAFAPKQDINNGVLTYALAAGDIDGDGKKDIVACSIVDLNISIFRNTSSSGSISFAPAINYATSSGVHGIAIGDMNEDGKPDIAVTNSTSNSISLFRNMGSVGSILFAAKVDFTTGLFPEAIAMGDLDSDGKIDILVSNKFSNSLSVFRNTGTSGSISLSTKVDISTGGSNAPYGIAIGDLDGDSKQEAAVVITNGSGVSGTQLYRNTSTAGNISLNYSLTVTGVSGQTAYHPAIGDINGDGKPDIAMSNTGAGLVMVYQNNSTTGTLAFGSGYGFPGRFGPYAIAIGDMNADNKPDLLATEFTNEEVLVYQSSCGSPAITSFSPIAAGASGTVTITGSNFTGVTGVSFGGIPAASFVVINSTTITAVVGTGASGDVIVTNAEGKGAKSGFQFSGPPVISSFTPTSGFSGTTVTISGFNFNGATAVRFGGTDAASFTIQDPSTIIANIASGTTGSVSVTTSFGTGVLAGFTYAPIPIINTFTPVSAASGNIVTITGINFTGTIAVSFGGVAASSFNVVNSNTITAVVANGASGNIVVTNGFGTSVKAGFIYLPPPTITSFSPVSGKTGTVVVINGSDFNNVSSVKFGGTNANSFNVINSTTINAVVDGNGSSGDVSVTTNPGGTASLPGFIFLPPPTITAFTPVTSGSGATVTITGTNFTGVSIVSFGGVAASSFTVVNSTTITAVIASGTSGNVLVTASGGTATLSGFSYLQGIPVINAISPLSGPIGTTVSITGANFGTGAANNIVYFGGVKGNVVSATANLITVTVPAGATNKPITVTSLTTSLTAASEFSFKVTFAGDPAAFNANSFAGQMVFNSGITPSDIDLGDIDMDGKLDIIVTNYNSPFISIFRNISTPGQLAFANRMDINVGLYANNTVIADMNGDGKLDLVVSQHYLPLTGNSNMLILSNKSSTGTIAFNAPLIFNTFENVVDITVGDFNSDGKQDIAGICINCLVENGGPVIIFRNIGTASNPDFVSYVGSDFTVPLGGQGYLMKGIEVKDLNKDNKPEIIFGTTNDGFVILRNTSNIGLNGTSFNKQIIGSLTANRLNAYPFGDDFDFDGNTDLITTSWININKGLLFDGTYNITRQQNMSMGAGLTTDLNGDGKPDIITQGTTLMGTFDKISIFKNSSTPGNVSFGSPTDYAANNAWMKLDAGDLDSDGKPEFCSANYGLNTISIYRNRIAEPAVVAAPTISSFTPTSAGYGSQVTITGINFTQATSVTFGGVAAAFFTVTSPTTIIAVVGTGASGSVNVTTPGGTASVAGFTFLPSPLPTITSFTPVAGGEGTIVTITGTNLNNASAINFGSQSATNFVISSPTSITATVGLGATGNVSVTTPGGVASLPGFLYFQRPSIASFTPTTAATGTSVTITGTDFTGATAVSFGGIAASSFTVVNTTTITAIVATGASGNVSVTTPGGTATRAGFIYIPTPAITSFTPTNSATGATITITGTNFTGATNVSFGGIAAASFTVVNATTIRAVVANGASGNVSVTTASGTATRAGFVFIPAPGIFSFTPTTGSTGSTITITGTNFNGATSVSFGATMASSFTVVNATTITAVIANGASGNITIITPGGTGTMAGFVYTVLKSGEITAVPNPANDMVVVTHPLSASPSYLKLIDINGRIAKLITIAPGNTTTSFSVKGMPAGIYQLVWTDGNETITKTLMISQ